MIDRSSKINLVLLTDCLADLAGGAEKQIYELAKGLDKGKYNVTIASLDCYGQAPRHLIESAGCRLEIFRVVRIYGITGLVQGLRFFRFLRKEQIDILQTYHFSSDIWGTLWGRLAGVPVIISNRRDIGFWRKGIHIAAYRWINRWVHTIVGNAQAIRMMVEKEEGVLPGKVEIIYNGVDLPSGVPDNDKSQLRNKDGKDIIIMHVANLKPVKGHSYLLNAFADVLKGYPDLKLILIGKDEYGGALQKLAQNLNIADKVQFLGKRDDVSRLLSSADICVLPSLSEGMSNSILEYMSAAKPVIATNVGGNPELVKHELNGLLVEKESADSIKNALETLIRDQERRRLMGEAGFQRVKNEFSMTAMVCRYDGLFIKLLKNIK